MEKKIQKPATTAPKPGVAKPVTGPAKINPVKPFKPFNK